MTNQTKAHTITADNIGAVLWQQVEDKTPHKRLVLAVIIQAIDDVALIDKHDNYESLQDVKRNKAMNLYFTGIEAKRYLYGPECARTLSDMGIIPDFAHKLFDRVGEVVTINKILE
jgi:hypothetical protein